MNSNGAIRILLILGISVCMMGSLTGCGKADADTQNIMQAFIEENEAAKTASGVEYNARQEAGAGQEQDSAYLIGTVTMAGSSSMEKFVNALAESFMAKYPGVTVTAEFTGSSTGIESVLAGRADIGYSSRSLSEEEKAAGAVENITAIDGIVVITDTSNPVTDLGTEQLVGIYTGDIRHWSEVSGADMAIVVVGREAGSGTRVTFEELLGIKDMCAYANELNSTGAVMAKVASTPGAIGYVSPDVLDDTVQPLSLDGIWASEENIKAGGYLLSRPFIMVTKGEISAQNEAVREMFAYLKSEEGQELIKAVGLVSPD